MTTLGVVFGGRMTDVLGRRCSSGLTFVCRDATSGQLGELMNDMDKALYCYENTLRHNPYSVKALMQIASICRTREQYPKVTPGPSSSSQVSLYPHNSSPAARVCPSHRGVTTWW
jgi:hypothetical protein